MIAETPGWRRAYERARRYANLTSSGRFAGRYAVRKVGSSWTVVHLPARPL